MADEKNELINQLARTRIGFSKSFGALHADVDVPARLRDSYQRNKMLWLGCAAFAGVLLAKLPARKKKIYVKQEGGKKIREAAEAGVAVVVLKFALSALRPVITSFITKKVAEYFEDQQNKL
jgi:hypothetical protein